MFSKYLITILCLFCVGNCAQEAPPCNEPLTKATAVVNGGENAVFNVTIYGDIFHRKHMKEYDDAKFSLVDKEGAEICVERRGVCTGTINSRIFMVMHRILHISNRSREPSDFESDEESYYNHDHRGEYYQNITNFTFTIAQSRNADSGIYLIQRRSYMPVICKILQIDVIVRETLPICSTLIVNEDDQLRLSCTWVPRKSEDMRILVGNRTLQLHENLELLNRMSSSAVTVTNSNYLAEIFDSNRIPDRCQVSDTKLGFEARCEFSVFMSPKRLQSMIL